MDKLAARFDGLDAFRTALLSGKVGILQHGGAQTATDGANMIFI